MSERLRQFVLGMSTDLERAKRLTADPEAELRQTDLSPEEQQIILSRDPDRIRQALGMAASDPIALNSFLETPPAGPRRPARKPAKRRPAKPARRKPARKPPSKKGGKKGGKKGAAAKRSARKAGRKTARKSARTPARKGSRRRG